MFNNGWFQIDGNFMYPSKEFVDMLRTCKKLGIEFEDGYVDLMLEDYEVMLLKDHDWYEDDNNVNYDNTDDDDEGDEVDMKPPWNYGNWGNK